MTEDEQKDARKAVLEEKKHVSSKISDLSRYIGFGLVAVVYTILTSDSELVISIYRNYTSWLLGVAVLGIFTIILDYLQFLGGYFNVQNALKNKEGNYSYNNESCSYKLRDIAFKFKQVTAFLGAFILIYVIARSAFFT
jgi:hypothetical protein